MLRVLSGWTVDTRGPDGSLTDVRSWPIPVVKLRRLRLARIVFHTAANPSASRRRRTASSLRKVRICIIYSDAAGSHRASSYSEASMSVSLESLPQLRFEIAEAARILRMSRATLYERIRVGEIAAQKDGRRRYITAVELNRYIASKG